MLSKKSLSMLNRYKMTILMTLMNTREIKVLQGIVKCNCKMNEHKCIMKVDEEIAAQQVNKWFTLVVSGRDCNNCKTKNKCL